VPDREESDQLPEEQPGSAVPDDDGESGDNASEQAGVPGAEGQGDDGQATGDPRNAGGG
jgi:hypothetical protein